MKRVISLMIAIVMLASLSIGLAITASADSPTPTSASNYITLSSDTPLKVSFSDSGNGEIYYSTNTENWAVHNKAIQITADTSSTDGKYHIYLCGSKTDLSGSFIKISDGSNVSVSGNIMSLLNFNNPSSATLTPNCFFSFFLGNNLLVSASNLKLPATVLAENCYQLMFYGCTSLLEAPKLPATEMKKCCYSMMFNGCSSLILPPELPATKLEFQCYMSMFSGCSALEITTDTNHSDDFNGTWDFTNLASITDCSAGMFTSTSNAGVIGSTPIQTKYFIKLSPRALNGEIVEEATESPSAEVEIDGMKVTTEYGNNSISLNSDTFNTIAEVDAKNHKIDLSSASQEIDKVILKNSVVKEIAESGKGVELTTRQAYAIISNIDGKIANSVTITLAEGVATYQQKKAMHGEVIAEITYGCTSNNKTLDTDAKIYVPCKVKNPRVYYIINANTIGLWPCEVIDGYCVFDRYLDGTYVVVK